MTRRKNYGIALVLGIATVTACAAQSEDGWFGTNRSAVVGLGPVLEIAADATVVEPGVTDAALETPGVDAGPPYAFLPYLEDGGAATGPIGAADVDLGCTFEPVAAGPDAGDGGALWSWHCGGCCADATRWVNACANAISNKLPGLGLAMELDCSKVDGGGVPVPPMPKFDKDWTIIVDQLLRCALPPVATTPEDQAKCVAAQAAAARPGGAAAGHAVAFTCKRWNDDYQCVVIDRFSDPPRVSPVVIVKAGNKIPITATGGKVTGYVTGPVAPSIATLEAMFPGCTVARPTDSLKDSGGVYLGPHPVSCIADAPPDPFPVPAPDAGKKRGICFYYCRAGDPNYWDYSSYSACKASDCNLKGQSSAGTCELNTNIIGECPL